ncbi:MAG: MFS transporter [Zoogloea sp.]|nr:MAG: MFS transporter [Zoogloea sp.]
MQAVQPSGWARRAPALRHRRFRRYFAGQAVSVLGSWIQTVAMSWVVYRLTGSAALLGITAFLAQAPQLLVAPMAGVWIDRYDQRRMFFAVQGLQMSQALALALLAFLGGLQAWQLVALAAVQGLLNSFDATLRQSLLAHMVDDRRDLQSAIALNGSVFTSGRFLGPPMAGLLLGMSSEAVCFLANALSYVFLIVSLSGDGVAGQPAVAPIKTSLATALREGFHFAWSTPAIRTALVSLAILNATASSAIVLMPIYAAEVFGGDARILGWLLGSAGAGAMSATALLASHMNLQGVARSVWIGWLCGGVGLGGLGAVQEAGLAMPLLFLLGAGIATTNVSTNSLLQGMTPDPLRGRVISLFAALRFGMDAAGGLIAGVLAQRLGPVATVMTEATLLAAALIWLAPRLRTLHHQVA